MEAWSGIQLSGVTSTGNLKQLFPTWCPAGATSLANRTPGSTVRRPMQGTLYSVQIRTDGATAGYIELWDANGEDVAVDVSTADTVTNANLVALQALGKAKLIYRQDFTANSGAATPSAPPRPFMHGLIGRFVATGGYCELNLVVEHGFMLIA